MTAKKLRPEDSNIASDAFGPTPSQTVGPYFHQGLIVPSDAGGLDSGGLGNRLFPEQKGGRIEVRGRVLDADGECVPDALVELWQANAAGRYGGPEGFGRSDTRHPGQEFVFQTIKPGAVVQPGSPVLAPHLNVWLGLRGLLTHLRTRIYFEDEDNSHDPVLLLVSEARRASLIARQGGAAPSTYRLDIHLQGTDETVFFAFALH